MNVHVTERQVQLATPLTAHAHPPPCLVVAEVGADERQVARREELRAQRLEAGAALAELLDVEPVQRVAGGPARHHWEWRCNGQDRSTQGWFDSNSGSI